MSQSILIIGEDPDGIDFFSMSGMTAHKVRDGLNGSRDRLIAQGYDAHILWTRGDEAEGQVTAQLASGAYDVIVIGAGLRTSPQMAMNFERIINAIMRGAPQTKVAFNSRPDDSDAAALRHLSPAD